MSDQTLHSRESSFREKLIEHLFVAELLKYSWKRAGHQENALIEVSRADVDRGGDDLIAEVGGCLRHIQIKGSVLGSKTARQNVHVALADKPSGCVVWVYLNAEDWNLGPFLYFGGEPGEPMPSLGDKVARHTKGDATGEKKERPNMRELNKGRFRKLETVEQVREALFGIARKAEGRRR